MLKKLGGLISMDIPFSKLQQRIYSILISLQVSPDMVGFRYIADCLIMIMQKHGKKDRSFYSLYQDVANQYNVGTYCVKQGIHTAVERIWNKGKSKALNKIIGIDIYGEYDKPSVIQFLTIIAEKLMQEYCFTEDGNLIDIKSLLDHPDDE